MKAFVDEALEGEAQDVTDGFDESNQLRIVVMGAGGGGGNTVNRLSRIGIIGAELAACNTDAQDLRKIDQGITKILIGSKLTKGLGAGGFPEIGMKAAEASTNEIRNYLEGTHLMFLCAGMGGGTGTGASPVFAKIASQMNLMTLGIFTLPFLLKERKEQRWRETL